MYKKAKVPFEMAQMPLILFRNRTKSNKMSR